MRHAIISIGKQDKQFLEQHKISAEYIKTLIEMVLNTIKPSSRSVEHRIKIVLTDDECSVYKFDTGLFITKKHFKNTALRTQRYHFFSDLMHELGHYIQFKIDRVLYSMFAVDHDKISYTKYYNNITERQARRYGGLANEIVQLYFKMEKLKAECAKPLNSLRHGRTKTKKEKQASCQREACNQGTASCDSEGARERLCVLLQPTNH
jgi:hypothetical protein